MTTDSTKNHTLISGATTVNGDIHFEGELIIEGRVVGKVLAEEGSEAQLRVAESGSIEGDVEVPLVVINGNVNGNVRASKHIELAAQGLVNGNVVYNLIEMVMGSAVNGSLTRMDREEPEIALLELDKEEDSGAA
ncbi:MAG: polymer-forming cytoskeletal protein [Gammaproteobacteria bacterium]|nr:polymer-forming cytoskeletal protein [Gammaproteobacteria bacterium]MCY3687434.1 polymer-forming cytoskeletal protein [Gammaproteobacteria bacterium]MXX07080.1 polymer-forming cytoskeletal protein [Gammaproteobacteria bacterium]MYC58576.1 polymer-forming cytoskeletal protein [Gammaproteobacteria bacterium]MYE30014.1 polymer-forming cytoskeletal protein [Gammaproteobacteria bacterium]